ncbi:MAG TPA: maleylpyruvate isomerase family mycothiol-dependent enzyme [Jatrophihabitantaceae bacterium]|jgi:uncharacterized protein (TIGR03083 family)
MTPFDDELATLLALDALEADEQADAELRMGTFPPGISDTSAALAEGAAVPPPADLRGKTLAAALSRRPAGRPFDGTVPCEPSEGFDRTIADVYALLESLTPSEWNARAHPEHGRVRDLIAHLVGVERLSLRWLDPDDDMPEVHDHVAATRPVIDELRILAPDELARTWHDAVRAVAAAAAHGDPTRMVSFHDIRTTVPGFLITRTFELWAHAMDISVATGRPLLRLDPERMATLSNRLMGVVGAALAYRSADHPGRSVRFVLTGPAGGSYTVALTPNQEPGVPDATIVADAYDICRVAARRLDPDELPAVIEGDRELAGLVLAGLDSFARD